MEAEGFECGTGEVGTGEANRGQRRQGELCEIDVVESNDREVLWHTQALKVGCAKDPDCSHVVGADDSCGLPGEGLEFAEADHSTFKGVIAFDNPFLLDRKLFRSHCIFEVVLPGDGRMQFVRASEEGDLAVFQCGEVVDGCANAGAVVEQDGAG